MTTMDQVSAGDRDDLFSAIQDDRANEVPRPGAKVGSHGVSRVGSYIEDSETAIGERGEFYRYTLHRRWGGAGKTILWVVLAPRAPAHGMADTMVDRCMAWSHRWGHNGLIITSLYPICSRNADETYTWRDCAIGTQAWDHVRTGALVAREKVKLLKPTRRMAAWGRLDPKAREDLFEWLERFGTPAPNECLGVSELKIRDPLGPSTRGSARPLPSARPQPFVYPAWVEASDDADTPPAGLGA